MLTIKIIDENNTQIVQEAKSVIYVPKTEYNSNYVTYFETEVKRVTVFSGDIYVMNDNGKTVANYCLGHPKTEGNVTNTDNVERCKE